MMFPRPWALIVAACLCWVSDAAANGRFPRSQRLIRNPTDAQQMVLAGTFGLAVTRDGGATWSHICESAFTEPNTILDPLVGFSKTGTLYTGTLVDLRRSDAAVCQFDKVLGDADTSVPDYTFDVDGETVVALTSKTVAGLGQTTLQTSKDGEAWVPLGSPIAERGVLTLDVAPSDNQRLYVTALAPELDAEGKEVGQRGVLLVSEDRGSTWEELPVPGTSLDSQPFIAAVHPTNADTLFVRLHSTRLNELDLPVADDALIVSYDAGRTWTELLRKAARLFAFALGPDATTVLAGFGTPDNTQVDFLATDFGLYRLAPEPGIDSGTPEAQHILEKIPIHCLTWTDKELFVCMKQFEAGFEVGVTDDPGFTEFSALKSVLLLNHVEGPSVCPSDSEAAACADLWENMSCKQLFACMNDAPAVPSSEPGPVPAADASAAPNGAGGAPPEPAIPPAEGEKKSDSNCGCRVGTATASPLPTMLGLWLALALVWRRGWKRAKGEGPSDLKRST